MVSLFVILGFLVAQIFTLAENQTSAQNENLKKDLIGNFSRSLTAAQEKDLVVSWNDQEKNIPLKNMTTAHLRQYTGEKELIVNFPKLEKILAELASEIKKDPVNARLEYDPDKNRIKEFSLPQNGRRLNIQKTAANMAANLAHAQLETSLIIDEIIPLINKNSLEQFGITTLLAKGESDFKGSTSNRIHNITVGVAKFQGLLLKPGEEFSFNRNLGEVDAVQGYQAELVIKNNKVIPEYGGGLCQVSTTLFRSVLNSGLLILERHPHSFPVHYYNPQGFDATIYPGVSDLRFKNDTASHLLIQNHIEGTKLVFEIFGSSDGRKVVLRGPKVLEQNNNGSMKTVLTRKIILTDDTVKEENFWSNYKSPAAFPTERNPLE